MENTIIMTGLGVTLTISIILGIVVSYLRLIMRKLDRVRDYTQKDSQHYSSITQTYIDNLNKQNRTLVSEVTRLSFDNALKEGKIKQLETELEMANKEKSGD